MAVGILDVGVDFCDQFLHAAKPSPAKSSLRDAIEPDFHLIEPGGLGRSAGIDKSGRPVCTDPTQLCPPRASSTRI